MCYDRTSVGKRPMCATVCPSQALFFGTREQIEQLRPRSHPINRFQFGGQTITTLVQVLVPRDVAVRAPLVDVTAAMEDRTAPRTWKVLAVADGNAADALDPFAAVEVPR
jgi:Fe-S-cluster-containing dehydrogenase component